MTKDGWFYAEGESPVGPIKCETLVALLRFVSEPGKVKVWRTGFPDWQDARTCRKSSIRFLGRRLFQGGGSKELRGLLGTPSLSRRKTKQRAARKTREVVLPSCSLWRSFSVLGQSLAP